MVFCLEARRRPRKIASAMRPAPATADNTPATMGVESAADCCSDGVDPGLAIEVLPKDGAGVGAGDAAASGGEDAAVGNGSVKTAACHVDYVIKATAATPSVGVEKPYVKGRTRETRIQNRSFPNRHFYNLCMVRFKSKSKKKKLEFQELSTVVDPKRPIKSVI